MNNRAQSIQIVENINYQFLFRVKIQLSFTVWGFSININAQ